MAYTGSETHVGNVVTTMTVTLKPKTEITVPKSIRRKAGIKPGDQVEFSVSGRVINITPKLSPDELQDEQETRDPKVREHIRKSNADYLAGRSRPAKDFLSELRAEVGKPRNKRPFGVMPAPFLVRTSSHYERLARLLRKRQPKFDAAQQRAFEILGHDPRTGLDLTTSRSSPA